MSTSQESPPRPLLIELEGIDGAGKTSVQKMLAKLLTDRNIPHVLTREAGNPHVKVCGQLREIALNPQYGMVPEAMECLFAAQRIMNYEWFKTVDLKTIVVSDRGILSHSAYGYASLPWRQIDALFETYCKPINDQMRPYVIYLQIDPKIAAERMQARGGATDNVEQLGVQHQTKVLANFVRLIEERSLYRTLWVIDANQDMENVHSQLEELMDKIVELHELHTQTSQ